MATAPTYAATPRAAGVTLSATADTSLTAPTNFATVLTAGASGSKIQQVRIIQILTTTVSGIVNLFIYDGTNYNLFDYMTYSAVSLSTTSQVAPSDFYYPNLVLPNGYSLRATNTVAAGSGPSAATHKLIAIGADY